MDVAGGFQSFPIEEEELADGENSGGENHDGQW